MRVCVRTRGSERHHIRSQSEREARCHRKSSVLTCSGLWKSQQPLTAVSISEVDARGRFSLLRWIFLLQISSPNRGRGFHSSARKKTCHTQKVRYNCITMDQPASSCMRSAHPSSPIWGCMRNPHAGVSGANLQSPYQQASFSLHQKPEFLAYTDFTSSCLVPTPPHAAYPREDRPYQESQGGYHRADWQFNPCETRVRAPEACPPVVAPVAVGGGGGGPEMDSAGGDRLPGAVPGCLEGEYSPQSVTSADSDKKSSSKRKRDVTGESEGTLVLVYGKRRESKKLPTGGRKRETCSNKMHMWET